MFSLFSVPDMKSSHIHLLGYIDGDPKGYQRLTQALEHEAPDAISISVSSNLRDYLNSHWLEDHLRKLNSFTGLDPEVYQFIEKQIREVYRYPVQAAQSFATKHNVPMHYVGDSCDVDAVRDNLRGSNKASAEDVNVHQREDLLSQRIDAQYRVFSQWFNLQDAAGDLAAQVMMNDFVGKFLSNDPTRDAYTAEQLTVLSSQVIGKIVHIHPLDYLTDDLRGQSLYERVRFLNPTRASIAAYDSFKKREKQSGEVQ